MREELEKTQQQIARQAAPFRREERKKIPPDKQKPPGRKPGHPGCCRRQPEHIDQTIEVALDNCPKCSGPVKNIKRVEQTIEEIPPVRPWVVKLITYRGKCDRCGVVGTYHPLQTSYGQGAAKIQLGPRALALAACLNKVHGLTMRKTCKVLYDLCGLRVTAGGLSQALSRVASRVKWIYEKLIEDIRGSPAVFADETSWWVGGPKYWLWVFTTAERTVYRVDQSRGSAVVRNILGDDFDGMLVSDCLSSYDPADYDKHKCIAHHLRAISKAMKYPHTDDHWYLLAWRSFFHGVIALYNIREYLSEEDFAGKCKSMGHWRDKLLNELVSQPGDVAVRNRLLKQRKHLLGCLYEPAAEPTNNRAERALRAAVIARKVSCGNKTERGRDCWEILSSIGATCQQQTIDFVEYLSSHLPLTATVG
ncbi:MAG: IS66 family transposase [Sedimentisphaerales bacterium]